jgi:hypothetical protein
MTTFAYTSDDKVVVRSKNSNTQIEIGTNVAGVPITLGTSTGTTTLSGPAVASKHLEFLDLAEPVNPGSGKGRLFKQTGFAGIYWKADAAQPALDLLPPVTTKGDVFTHNTSRSARLPAGADGQVLVVDSAETTGLKWTSDAYSTVGAIAIFRDEKAMGTNGGSFNTGSWVTRDLNISEGDLTGISLSTNQLTLPAGVYYVSAVVPAYAVLGHQARLYNVTDSTASIYSSNQYTRQTGGTCSINGFLTIASSKTFRVEHRCEQSQASDGFGRALGFGTEVYTIISFIKRSS